MNNLSNEPHSEIANILECIVEYPKDGDPKLRSDYFAIIQEKTKEALTRLNQQPVYV